MSADLAPSVAAQIDDLFKQLRDCARTATATNNHQGRLKYEELSECIMTRAVLYEMKTARRRLAAHSVRDHVGFNFVEYVDNQPSMNPHEIFEQNIIYPHHLISLLRYAYNKDDNSIMELIEQFLLTDIKSILFNQYQLVHIAHRFNFPTLRKHCHAELTTVEQMREFNNQPEVFLQLSCTDRAILDIRHIWLLISKKMEMPLIDEFYARDFHSLRSFEDSIATRYVEHRNDEEAEGSNGFSNDIIFDGFF